ncbi:hypothetical protein [Crenobacter caeni]|uniref:Uncharacterized protein n=1 Tax=Crenobacter caeni TaxID=2705474 RepID=A0A6B2KRZ4_9NEIS|nr:hypothetical protein [Crenobacter caeni]NDV12831.1 hypothetical protein [Crenobacter caeni]
MYDCQTDTYTEFQYGQTDRPAIKPGGLRGPLEAISPEPAQQSALVRLLAHASALGYECRHHGDRVRVLDVCLEHALQLDAAFGAELAIRCELRIDGFVPLPS